MEKIGRRWSSTLEQGQELKSEVMHKSFSTELKKNLEQILNLS